MIDQNDGLARRRVALADVSSVNERNSHGTDVAICDHAYECVGRLTGGKIAPFHTNAPTPVAAQGERIGETGGSNSRNLARPAQDFIEIGILLGLRVVLLAGIHAYRCGALGLKTQVDIQHVEKTANQQTRSYQPWASGSAQRACAMHPWSRISQFKQFQFSIHIPSR